MTILLALLAAPSSSPPDSSGRHRHFVMLDDPGTLFAEMDSFLGER